MVLFSASNNFMTCMWAVSWIREEDPHQPSILEHSLQHSIRQSWTALVSPDSALFSPPRESTGLCLGSLSQCRGLKLTAVNPDSCRAPLIPLLPDLFRSLCLLAWCPSLGYHCDTYFTFLVLSGGRVNLVRVAYVVQRPSSCKSIFPQVTDNTVRYNGKQLPGEITNHAEKHPGSCDLGGGAQRIHKFVDNIC